MVTRRTLLKLGAATAATIGTAQLASASGTPRLSRHRLFWPVKRPLRIAHLTDLHVGWGTPKPALLRAAALCRAARPDLVVLTGDYLNVSLHHLESLRRWLRTLPRPCVATLGNHDHWSGAEAVERALTQEGILVLRNGHRLLRVGGCTLPVVGVDDGYTKHADPERAFFGLSEPEHALVLTHLPETASAISRVGGRLVLAGHTHGGQLNIPKLTEAVARAMGHHYLAGWYRLAAPGAATTRLYVNAGVGSSAIRLRAGRKAQPEVALFELLPTPNNALRGVHHG